MAMENSMPEFCTVASIPDATPRIPAGTALMTELVSGGREKAHPDANEQQKSRKRIIVKIDRQPARNIKATEVTSMPPVEKILGSIGPKIAGNRPRDKKANHHRQHIDAGPQWRLTERVSVNGKPDPLQPDDEHELHRRARSHPTRLQCSRRRMRVS